MSLFLFLSVILASALARPASGAGGPVAGKINVHLVCHTHDDVGWLKTVDQYFYGANNSIQPAGVQYILDTVVDQLKQNPNRKFIYVEQAFFQRWWREQDEAMRNDVVKLAQNGQLEFINGGWCMHDEAATHYVAMIDQTTLGHRYLKEQFGDAGIPKVGWQIDPFGHSATQASLLSARVGFEGLFFARIDYQDSQRRNADKDFEFLWRPSPSLGLNGQVFTGAFERNGYGPPRGFNWDWPGDAPIQDDPRLEDYNVESRVQDFVNVVMDQYSSNRGDDIMFTLGSDFQYSNARPWFKNLDKLIDHVNKDGRVNAFYSTPSMYVKAKMSSGIQWTVKTDDLFPYADCPHCYWTGYFTSRTALKRYVRMNSAYLNFVRQLEVFASAKPRSGALEEAMGVAQHHDAVSGTSKQHVAYDYARRIAHGHSLAADFVNDFTTTLVGGNQFSECTLLNETICPATQSFQAFAVVAYNSQARARTETVRLPVSNSAAYHVYDSKGNPVPSQTLPSFSPFPKNKPAPYALYFQISVPALGYTTYFVQPTSKPIDKPQPRQPNADYVIENSQTRVTFDQSTGRLSQIVSKSSGVTSKITHDFLYYDAYARPGDQHSGAYIFRPNGNTPLRACPTGFKVTTFTGPAVSEIRVTYCDWLALTARLNGNDPNVEFEYQIGAIPIFDGVGKEVISRFSTDIQSGQYVYTDSNGREFQQRRFNYRPTWNLTVNEPVAGNYYPVNVGLYIRDTQNQFSVLTDRTVGGASLNSGQVELMIQRRLLVDDGRGVGEPLNETDGITPYPDARRVGTGMHVTGSQYLLLDPNTAALKNIRSYQSRIFSPLNLVFAPMAATGSSAVQQWIQNYKVSGTEISTELPVNVELMTLQSTGTDEHIIRISHQFGVGEDSVLSRPVTVDFSTLFANLKMVDVKEVSLTTNQDVKDMKAFQWPVEGENVAENSENHYVVPFDGVSVTINPMDVRTFTFKLAAK